MNFNVFENCLVAYHFLTHNRKRIFIRIFLLLLNFRCTWLWFLSRLSLNDFGGPKWKLCIVRRFFAHLFGAYEISPGARKNYWFSGSVCDRNKAGGGCVPCWPLTHAHTFSATIKFYCSAEWFRRYISKMCMVPSDFVRYPAQIRIYYEPISCQVLWIYWLSFSKKHLASQRWFGFLDCSSSWVFFPEASALAEIWNRRVRANMWPEVGERVKGLKSIYPLLYK